MKQFLTHSNRICLLLSSESKIYICILLLSVIPNRLSASEDKRVDSLLSVIQSTHNDTLRATNYLIIADIYMNRQLPDGLEFGFKALEIAEKLHLEKLIALAKSDIGRSYWMSGNFQEAKKYHLEALEIYIDLGDQKNIALLHLQLGQDHADAGGYFKSIEYLQLSLSEFEKLKDKVNQCVVDVVLAFVYLNLGKYAEAVKYQYNALKLGEELGDDYSVAISLTNLAYYDEQQGNYSKAIDTYKKTIDLLIKTGDKINTISVYNAIGNCYVKIGNFNEAMKTLSLSLDAAIKFGNHNSIAESYESIADLNFYQNKIKEALNYYNLSLTEYLANENIKTAARIYTKSGDCYLRLNRNTEAKKAYDNAYQLAVKLKSPDGFINLYKSLVSLDSITGNWKNAFEHYKLYIVTRDSMYNEENTKKIVQTQMQYDFDKKAAFAKSEQDKKDAEAQAALQRQKLIRNGFMGGFGVVILFAGVVFYQRNKIKSGKKQSDELLLNILPAEVADELKEKGSAEAKLIDRVTVLFSDFKNFTTLSSALKPSELVAEINECFSAFDHIMQKFGIEKIKTVGDAYMAAGGLPSPNESHPFDILYAAIEMQKFMSARKMIREAEGKFFFEARIGAHTGPVVAGIVGVKKFAYDIWGDTVNMAQRMESNSEAGKINISKETYELVKSKFDCFFRGKIEIKGKGFEEMYFVNGLHP